MLDLSEELDYAWSTVILFLVRATLSRLVAFQLRRPGLVLAIAAATLIPSWLLAQRLELRTGFDELLPDNQPSVVELRRTSKRLPSMSTLAVTVESKDPALIRRFIDEMVPKLREFPKDLVSSVEGGTKEAQSFFEQNKHLYARLADIESLHEDIVSRYDWEVGKRLGTNVDEDEPPPITAELLKQRFNTSLKDARAAQGGSDGYYIGENGRFGVILVRTPLRAMDLRAFDLQRRITELVRAANWTQVDPGFRIGFTGNLVTSAEEYQSVSRDLTQIGAVGVGLVLMVVYFFFWRLRVLLALAISIGFGCIWCFAFAELAVGHLNTATGFLVSVVAGNGINAMIIYMARFVEARRDQGMTTRGALFAASNDTHAATFAAVAVAMVSYGALMTTDFRGFRHFGIIGAVGMLLCWVSTYTVLPALLAIFDRLRPFPAKRDWRDKLAGSYARPFIWLAKRFSTTTALVGGVLGALGLLGTVLYFTSDPMEYNLRKIRNVEGERTVAGQLSSRMNKVVPRINQSGRAVLVDRLDQVPPLVAELERRREAAPKGEKPFADVVSIYSLVPKDQEKKLELLAEIKDRVERARQKGLISDPDWKALQEHLPAKLAPLGLDDLPELVARPFSEKDGTRGKIVYVAPASGRSLNDARYLIDWADSFREVRLPNGDVIRGSGDAVVFADMLTAIAKAAPRVALLSLLGTIVVILISFRGRVSGWISLGVLGLGLSWLIAALYVFDVKLNFLNFMALPIAIGVGSDYAINVMKRREIEGDAGIERAFTETGGAVVACSMTTMCGYAALLFSVNGAVRTLGLTAGLGELMTQLAAMLVLPAFLYWYTARRERRTVTPGSV